MTDNEKDWFKLYTGLAMLGTLIRTKGNIFPDEVAQDSVLIAKVLLNCVKEKEDNARGDH
jgi:hypothetical protein